MPMPNTIVTESPWPSMTMDNLDPQGWMKDMDIVVDGDREVCIVICTAPLVV